MAARVGTGVTGDNFGVSSFSSAAKSTTTGNTLIAVIGSDITATTVSSITDTAGNTWNIIAQQAFRTVGNTCLAYAANITGNASNVVTVNFGVSTGYVEMVVEEFSGLATSSVLDGSAQTNSSSSNSDYTTADITTTSAGLVVLGVRDWNNSLASFSGTPGNPDFSVGAIKSSNPGCGFFYYISGSAQTITPGGSTTGGNGWGAVAQAFKDASSGPVIPVFANHYRQQGIQ